MHVVATLTTFTCLATVVVLSRLYTRFRIMRSPGLDDCTIVAALVADLVFFGLAVAGMHNASPPNPQTACH